MSESILSAYIDPQIYIDDPDSPRKLRFLATLEETGNVTQACKAAATTLAVIDKWRKQDEEFANAIIRAGKIAGSVLEWEARRRAYEGCRKYKFSKGEPVMWRPPKGHPDYEPERIPIDEPGFPGVRGKLTHYYELDYSDSLLMFLMKGQMPEKYSEKVDHTGTMAVKLYAGIEAGEIGSRSIKDLPSGGECEVATPIDGHGDSFLWPSAMRQVEGVPGEDSLPLHELSGVPGASFEADEEESGSVGDSDF